MAYFRVGIGGGTKVPTVEMKQVSSSSAVNTVTFETKGAKKIILCVERGNYTKHTYRLSVDNGTVTDTHSMNSSSYYSSAKFLIEDITSDTITATLDNGATTWVAFLIK